MRAPGLAARQPLVAQRQHAGLVHQRGLLQRVDLVLRPAELACQPRGALRHALGMALALGAAGGHAPQSAARPSTCSEAAAPHGPPGAGCSPARGE